MAAEQEFTVADVYQHAALIGQDIEVIVNDYGKEAIEEIMPKIVYVLEKLEGLAERRKLDQERVDELTLEKDSLVIHTKRDEAIQRQLEEKLTYMEKLVSDDKKELETKIRCLQQENDCLCDEIDKCEKEIMKLRSHGALPGDVEVMFRMKTTIDAQRDQMRQLNGEMQSQKREVEAVQEHVHRLTEINEKLRRNTFLLQSRLKQFESNNKLSEIDGPEENKVDIDAESAEIHLDDGDNINNKSLSEELQSTMNDSETEDSQSLSSILTDTSETKSSLDRAPSQSIKDPDRPRYTLKEMSDVLDEKNRYKIDKLALEEELELYKKEGRDRLARTQKSSPADHNRKSSGVRTFMQKFLGK